MDPLQKEDCEPCRVGGIKLGAEEIVTLSAQLPGWEIGENNAVQQLMRTFHFADFKEALSFGNRVGELAEQQGHHPDLLTQWGKLTVSWWTHKIGGLHRNDFIMAAKTDRLYEGESCRKTD